MWHCPHCGAPQAETARCWVCRRSSTTCSTCRHFRRALSADLGYCALDRRRRPITGLELRGCWEERIGAADPAAPLSAVEPHRLRSPAAQWPATTSGLTTEVAARRFVPLELLGRLPESAAPGDEQESWAAESGRDASPPILLPEADEDWTERTSLFGDADR